MLCIVDLMYYVNKHQKVDEYFTEVTNKLVHGK